MWGEWVGREPKEEIGRGRGYSGVQVQVEQEGGREIEERREGGHHDLGTAQAWHSVSLCVPGQRCSEDSYLITIFFSLSPLAPFVSPAGLHLCLFRTRDVWAQLAGLGVGLVGLFGCLVWLIGRLAGRLGTGKHRGLAVKQPGRLLLAGKQCRLPAILALA